MTNGVDPATTKTLMRVAHCTHCSYVEDVGNDATGVPRMCNGCGHFGSYNFVGVTIPEIAEELKRRFAARDAT